jgi:HEAT repeat protein
MLSDRTLGEFQRRTAVWRLGDRRDPRAVPHLILAVKTDPSGSVVNQAITVLAVFKSKAAVKGLIDCFDADFGGKSDWKRACTPAMFRSNIAESLREITGQSLGPDKEQWQTWWKEKGERSADLR